MSALYDDPFRGAYDEPWRDKYDRVIDSMIAHRDTLIAAATGSIPQYGSRAWTEADDATRTASYAQAEATSAVAHGREISDRLAADLQAAKEHVEVSHAIAGSGFNWRGLAERVADGGRAAVEARRNEYPPPALAPAAAARGDPAVREAVDRATEAVAALAEAGRRDELNRQAATESAATDEHEHEL